MPQIIRNAILTPDGTILESKHSWDYKEHKDKNGKTYVIDGGNDYIRCSNNGDEVLLTITSNDPFILIREVISRFNLFTGEHVPISQMSNEWLENTIEFLLTINNQIKDSITITFYIREKQYRMENEIYIPEDEKITVKAESFKKKLQKELKRYKGKN